MLCQGHEIMNRSFFLTFFSIVKILPYNMNILKIKQNNCYCYCILSNSSYLYYFMKKFSIQNVIFIQCKLIYLKNTTFFLKSSFITYTISWNRGHSYKKRRMLYSERDLSTSQNAHYQSNYPLIIGLPVKIIGWDNLTQCWHIHRILHTAFKTS